MLVKKRCGELVPWDSARIANAVLMALNASKEATPLSYEVMARLIARLVETEMTEQGKLEVDLEDIQDTVEVVLMTTANLPKTAKAYVLYREERARARAVAK